jgi:hypothetical protein
MYQLAISLIAGSMLASDQATPSQTPAQGQASPPPASSARSITYGGGNGTTCDRAIIVQGAHGEADGVHSEYDWLKAHYPGYKMVRQAEVTGKDKMYDQLDFADKDGKSHSVCFDITSFFGHF